MLPLEDDRFRILFERSHVAMVFTAVDGRFIAVNSAACELFGRSAVDLIGRSAADVIHPDDQASMGANMQQLQEGSASSLRSKRQFVRADGATVWGDSSTQVVMDPDGRPLYWQSVIVDITEKELEQARVAALLEVEAMRTEREALAGRMQQSQRLEGLGQLAGGVAHDFNNLLAVILNYTSFVTEQTAGNEAVQADLAQIREAANRAAELTRQLLILGRRDTVRPEVLDLNSVVADVQSLLSRSIGEHIELIVERSSELPALEADRGQIEQVLVNLAVNARDAMPNGGTLTIETRTTRLDADYCRLHPAVRPGSFVEVSISDTGSGMSAEVVSHIFEPFFTTKPPGEATGLGLATVYGIVTEAGGSVSVYSEEGTGTTFRLFFPAVDPWAPASTERDERTEPVKGGQTILVVEDEPAMMEVTARILGRNGYNVIKAPTGAEALEIAAREHIDLLLTDSVMPRMSGRELAERVAELKPELPVLFMSGYSQGVLGPQRILEEGVALIQKPFNEQMLLDYVTRSLTRDST